MAIDWIKIFIEEMEAKFHIKLSWSEIVALKIYIFSYTKKYGKEYPSRHIIEEAFRQFLIDLIDYDEYDFLGTKFSEKFKIKFGIYCENNAQKWRDERNLV